MLIDTHAHLNFNAYKNDVDKVIKRSLSNNVWMINVGSTYETSKIAVEIAERYGQGVFAAIGLHPIHLAEGIFKAKLDKEEIAFQMKNEQFDYEKYKELAKSSKVVAIGEIGLDYYWKPKTKNKLEQFKNRQKQVFLQQFNLAKELNLPIIFHCRFAHDELLEILKFQITNHKSQTNSKSQIQNSKLRGVIHCFTGNWQQAEKYLEMGLYLGFNGIIFKNIEGINFEEIIKKVPLNRILLETDCPYLTPPEEENKRNEPIYIKYIAEKIAEIKNLTYNKVAKITTENAKKLFKI
jgi:TatD DNase family protein